MLRNFIVREWPLIVALFLLIGSSLYLERFPQYHLEDFKVIFTLWVFLLIVKGLYRSGFFKEVALHLEKGNFVSLKLVVFTFLLSMFITNDAALFVVVPATMLLNLSPFEKLLTVVGEATAANIGSALLPFGNPQNIYLYFHFKYTFWEFVKAIYPFAFLLFPLIVPFFVLGIKAKPSEEEKFNLDLKRKGVALI